MLWASLWRGQALQLPPPPPPPNQGLTRACRPATEPARAGTVRRAWRHLAAFLICLPLLAVLTGPALAQSTPRIVFSNQNLTLAEDGALGNYELDAFHTGTVTSNLTVNYTMGGTATAGTDYTISGGTFNYSNGTGTFTITAGADPYPSFTPAFTVIPTPDSIQDTGETIILTLVAGTGYHLTNRGIERIVTLVDNTGEATFALSGNPWVGETLTVTRTADDPDGNGTIHRRYWQRRSPGGEWSNIRSQGTSLSSETYVVAAEDLGMELRGEIQYTDGGGVAIPVVTSPVGPVEPAGGSAVEWNACVPQSLRDHVDARIKMASTNRWIRIKNALTGRSNAIPLAEVREIHDRRLRHGWSLNRLDEVIAAMECMARGLPSSAPVISISAGDNITEGSMATFTLTADPAPTSGLTVAVQMKNININVADDDGDIRTRELTIGTNGTATIGIRTLSDSNQWPDGTVYVAVQPGTSYRVAAEPNNAASVSVANDDFNPALPTLSVDNATVRESDRNCVRGYFTCMKFTVTLSRAPAAGERVDFAYETRESSSGRPATAREDFYPVEGVGTFKPGDALTQTIEVHIYDDYVSDPGETFELVITHAWGATFANDGDSVGIGTINNDDPLPATIFNIPSTGFSSEVGFLDPAPRSSLELDLWNREQPAGAQRGFTPNLATGACVSPGLLSEAAGYAGEIWRGPAHVERWLRVMQTFSGSASDATIVTPAEAQHYAIGGAEAWLPVATALRCLEAQVLGGALLQ